MKRVMGIVAIMGLAACQDVGLPDRNLPLQEARHRQYGYPTYQPAAEQEQIAAAGRHWMASLPVERIPDRLLVPVGNTNGTPLYALRGSDAPHSRLYARAGDGRWRPFLRLN
jgi:hypothetical protein